MNTNKQEKQLQKLKELQSYRFVGESYIEELELWAVQLEHKKNKARILLLPCEDENKVFTIGFRTPSIDSTGVAHILEHSVLCGSRKFPLKDPFVELVKGSLNTFLNAMTYMDKTLYPVASCNDKDFRNLMDVYLDAVLYPRVHQEEKIFLQEGWHYELYKAEDELKINGVVYNEMKGAFSSADAVLERAVSKGLFSGHAYGEESGGDPDCIPSLSYESFLDFHTRYYHPSNSFIYLYGNMDMAETLDFIDKEYLQDFEYKDVDSAIRPVQVFKAPQSMTMHYPVLEEESLENASYLSLHTVVGGELEPLKAAALKILSYLLLDAPGAVLREALQEAGIGQDCMGGYEHGIAYPYFSVIAKNAEEKQREEFKELVYRTLRRQVEEGMDKEALLAAINISEFRAREADFGHYPRGLIYGLETFDSWLYDADPCMHLRYNRIFSGLRQAVEEGYFEQLIQELLLDNPFTLDLALYPQKGLAAQKDADLKEELAKKKAAMTTEEIQEIMDKTLALKAYQQEENTKEDLAVLPVLKRKEIKQEAEKIFYTEDRLCVGEREVPVIYVQEHTSGISYIKFLFHTDFLQPEELPYLALLKEILAYVDTDRYSYTELNTCINLHTGGLGFGAESYADALEPEKAKFAFTLNTKVLSAHIDRAMEIGIHVLLDSDIRNTKRLKDIILELKTEHKSKLLSAGHISAVTRAASYLSKDSLFAEWTRGISYYRFLEELSLDVEAKAEDLQRMLGSLIERCFTLDNLSLHFTGSKEDYESFRSSVGKRLQILPVTADRGEGFVFVPGRAKEAYTSASMVNYVARCGNYRKSGGTYSGAFKILKVLLSYDYLWNRIRVQGGAYGAMSSFGRAGSVSLSSYRDPHVGQTCRVYEGLPDFVRSFDTDELGMRKLVIGAISELDTPLTPSAKGLRALSAYMSGIDNDMLAKERAEILGAQPEDIRALAKLLEEALQNASDVSIGNEEKIRQNKEYYESIEALYKD